MYCTKQDLISRFGETELHTYAWDQEGDDYDDAQIDQACQDATDEINLYVTASITLPAATTPPALVRIACDIARYHVQARRPLDEVKERYKAAIATLRDIASGKASIGDAGTPTQPGHVEALKGESDRVFTDETLAGFTQDC